MPKKSTAAAAVAQAPKEPGGELAKFAVVLKSTKNRELLKSALTEGLDLSRFIKSAWIQAQINPDIRELAQKNPTSVFRAMLQCAQMGLYPDGVSGDAYLVRFGNECVAIRGYKGLMRLFGEHCPTASKTMPIIFDTVHENDVFEYERGTSPSLSHKPATKKERGDVTHYYAAARFNDGSIWPKVMTAEEVEEFKKYAKSSAFWDSPHANTRQWMRLKTVIKQLIKELPLPSHIRQQVEREEEGPDDMADGLGAVLDLELEPGTHVYGDAIKPTQAKPKPAEIPKEASNAPSADRPATSYLRSNPQTAIEDEPPPGKALGDHDPHSFQGAGMFCSQCGGHQKDHDEREPGSDDDLFGAK